MEDIVNFMKDLVTEASKPNYANEEVAKFDEFVRNGGSLRDFYDSNIEGKVNTENVDLESEFNQKMVFKWEVRKQNQQMEVTQ